MADLRGATVTPDDSIARYVRVLLMAAGHALRSYQYGNASTELAKEMADHIDRALKEAPTMIKPTIGRVVWFQRVSVPAIQANAAIITFVWSDDLVDLVVFPPNAVPETRMSVPLYQGEGDRPNGAHCEWMPYQIGQAKQDMRPVQ